MTEVSSFDNWKLQKRIRVSASVLVDCNILTVTPDSFLSFFILISDSFANNFDFMLSNEGVNFCSDSCRVCMENTHFPLKLNTQCQIIFFNWCYSLVAVYFCKVGRNKICFLCLEKCFVFVKCSPSRICSVECSVCISPLFTASSKALLQCSIYVDLTSQNIC